MIGAVRAEGLGRALRIRRGGTASKRGVLKGMALRPIRELPQLFLLSSIRGGKLERASIEVGVSRPLGL